MDDNSVTTESVETESQAPEVNEEQASEVAEVKPRNVKKLKLKVDGKEFDEEVDLDNDDYLVNQLQLAKVAQKRMHEAANTRKDAERFIRMLQQDPIRVLQDPSLGIDFRNIAYQFLSAEVENDLLSPEEKQLREYKQKVEQFEEEKRRQKEESEAQQMQRLQEHYAAEFDSKITEALSMSGLPKTPRTVSRMVELMYKNLEYGYDFEPKQLVEKVRQDYLADIRELIGASEGDTLLNILGNDVSNKIRKADLSKLKNPTKKVERLASSYKPSEEKRNISTDDFIEEARRRSRE